MVAPPNSNAVPASVTNAVLVTSDEMPAGSQKVEELDFNKLASGPVTVDDLISGMKHMGFQATSIGEAVRIINDMVSFSYARPKYPSLTSTPESMERPGDG